MATRHLSAAAKLIRTAAIRTRTSDSDDGQLLAAFLANNDPVAFATILHRHGAMVFAVCQRVLGDYHAAEDAFQATFILLAQHAGGIRKRESLASWLHGVGLREVLKAIENLAVGKSIPDLEGSGLGPELPGSANFWRGRKKVKLSSYRGKVVLMDVWTTWCGPCRSMIPHEQELVQKLKAKPFALFKATAWDILSAIERGFRAQVDVKGKLAEWFLFKFLEIEKTTNVIIDFEWSDEDGKPDFRLKGPDFNLTLECKNIRTGEKYADGSYKLETQKTRNQKDPANPDAPKGTGSNLIRRGFQ